MCSCRHEGQLKHTNAPPLPQICACILHGNGVTLLQAMLNNIFTFFLLSMAIGITLNCSTGEHKHGGRVHLGPRGLLYMFVAGCSPTGIVSLPATPPSTKAEPIEQTVGRLSTFPQVLDLEHALSKRTATNATKDECFNPRTSVPTLSPTTIEDCSEAANALVHGTKPYKALIFARKSNAGFHLPQTVQQGSCVVSIDVASEDESDFFMPMVVYLAAMDLARRCIRGTSYIGGRASVGPKRVVNIVVSFRTPSLPVEEVSHPQKSPSPTLLGREQPCNSNGSQSIDCLSPQPAETLALSSQSRKETPYMAVPGPISNDSSALGSSILKGIPKCMDPPVHRTRAWPIEPYDCQQAILLFVGNRVSADYYTFTRGTGRRSFYYTLPVTFKYASCSLYMNMIDEHDEELVKLANVASTASFLAYACSGGDKPYYRYGGWVTMGLGAHDKIIISVYGRRPS